jgi:uncharacterized membrane protein
LDISEKILFSVGLSIAFLMLIGFFINELVKIAFANPLSLNSLILSINTILLLAAFIGSRSTDSNLVHTPPPKLSRYLFLILLSISLLLLGFYGIFIVNYSGNNTFILLLILAISIIVALVFLNEKILPLNLYPFLLLIIFVCMLLFVSTSYALVTSYITGTGDQWAEYYAFRLTAHFWDAQLRIDLPYYSMMSVTILPAVFLTVTAMNPSFLFKLLYPLVAAFIAVGTYKLYQTQTDDKTAFLATFFLITISVGKGMGPARQQIAELFYVLLFLMFFKKGISLLKRNVALMIFGTALVLSHYSLTYIFLLTMLASFLILVYLDYSKTGRVHIFQTKIPLTFLIIFSTIAFSWYIFVNASAAFDPLIETVNTVMSNLDQFFNLASRGTALQGLGLVQVFSIYYEISRDLFILTEFFVVLGFIGIVTRRDQASKFSVEYKTFAALNLAIIAINILLPRLADTFLMQRFYQITLIILAPLAVIGGKVMFEFVLKNHFKKFYIIALVFVVFIPLFLFQTNLIYEVTQDRSYNLPLSMYRWDANQLHRYIVSTQEVFGAQWIPQHANLSNIAIYSDPASISNVLMAYGMVFRGKHPLTNVTVVAGNGFVYLSTLNVVYRVVSSGQLSWNTSELSYIFDDLNIVYANGGSEVYRNKPYRDRF